MTITHRNIAHPLSSVKDYAPRVRRVTHKACWSPRFVPTATTAPMAKNRSNALKARSARLDHKLLSTAHTGRFVLPDLTIRSYWHRFG
jgi:hypothetical protein